jgi:hypothetical protein
LLTNAPEARENYFKNALRLYGETKTGETYAEAALELGHFYLSQRKNGEAVESFARVPQNSPLYRKPRFTPA